MNKHVILQDFILSRQAKLCSPATIDFYQRMLKPFIETEELTSRGVRRFLARLANRDLSPSTVHAHARAIRAFLRFAHEEEYLSFPVKFDMPNKQRKHMDVLSSEEIKQVLEICQCRDKALVMLLIDSGMRRGEALDLSWEDVDFNTGSILVRNGKGGKARTVFIGVKTRRAMLKLKQASEREAIFPLTASGVSSLFSRLSEKSGVHIYPHKCRRTFATLALRNGMNLFALQRLLGHSTLEMTRRYVYQLDSDLTKAHSQSGPMDHLQVT